MQLSMLKYLRSNECGQDASIQGLVQAKQQVGCHRDLRHINGAHSDPFGHIHSKCHWQ